ncbi:tRNA pseudouridine synthase-like 1 [Acanthaster planci]|uniref:tRNA pseudouridine synthase n=1 Tax=Acanthaster planci TaxID=133434 RepID=A0A8B7YB80_ACAPL|nr:tRNA pseudouridine synthase-like 1 [Acanthaster planci]
MVRYLIHFQYIGTKYCGVVRAPKDTLATSGKIGVQDAIEKALARLNPYQPTKIHVSSRTDAGVHALCNTAHFDLVRPPNKPPAFHDQSLCLGLNSFIDRSEQVRVMRARRVPDNFHCQHRAVSRSYLYRIAAGCTHRNLPITERDRCWPVSPKLNVEAMKEATKIFLGTHDFSAFQSMSKDSSLKSPVKTMDSIEIAPSQGFLSHHWSRDNTPDIQFLEVSFRSRSFLYRQIRRMVSALVSVGKGSRSLDEVKEVLESRNNAHPRMSHTAPPEGLYLKEVLYDEQAKALNACCWTKLCILGNTTAQQSRSKESRREVVKHCRYQNLYPCIQHEIRRMVSALVSVGKGSRSLDEVKEVLESRNNAHPRMSHTAPPEGLYLKEVLYDEQDLLLENSSEPECENLEYIQPKS